MLFKRQSILAINIVVFLLYTLACRVLPLEYAYFVGAHYALVSIYLILVSRNMSVLSKYSIGIGLILLVYSFVIIGYGIFLNTNSPTLLLAVTIISLINNLSIVTFIIVYICHSGIYVYAKYLALELALSSIAAILFVADGKLILSGFNFIFKIPDMLSFLMNVVNYMTILIVVGLSLFVEKYHMFYKLFRGYVLILMWMLMCNLVGNITFLKGHTLDFYICAGISIVISFIYVYMTSSRLRKSTPIYVVDNYSKQHFDVSKSESTLIIFTMLFVVSLILHFYEIMSEEIFIQVLILLFFYGIISMQFNRSILVSQSAKNEELKDETINAIIRRYNEDLIETNKKLTRLLKHDRQTDLPNRESFLEDVDSYIGFNKPFVVIIITIGNFEILNNIYETKIINRLVKYFSDRMRSILSLGESIYRLSKDEFAIISFNDNINYFETFYNSLHYLGELEYKVDEYRFSLRLKVGFSRYPTDVKSSQELFMMSNLMAFDYKRGNELHMEMKSALRIMEDLSKKNLVIQQLNECKFDEEFFMVYQPQFDINTKELVGVEALLRWNHKGRFISPGIFIQIAESIGYIRSITEWVCKKVIEDYMIWKELLPEDFMVGINISPLSLNSDDFIDFFLNTVEESDYDYSFFDLEITEYVELGNAPDLLLRLRRLSDSGTHLSVDDFGTGYSSISYICLYNINRLKISKELVDNMVENEDSRAIVKAIIDMSKSLGVKTIAEGVEYENQLNELKKLGCDQIQGYIWSKPLPFKELEDNYIRSLCRVFDEKVV